MSLERAELLEGIKANGADHEKGKHVNENQCADGQYGLCVSFRNVFGKRSEERRVGKECRL